MNRHSPASRANRRAAPPDVATDRTAVPSASPDAHKIDVLDVRLLDLFAQVEAMLRYARDIQRYAIPLRGTSAPLSPRRRRALSAKIRAAVRRINRESNVLKSVVEQVLAAVNDLP